MSYHIELPEGAYHVVTALDHCAWPNLTMLPNGEIGAIIYNQPSHGWDEGDPELWVSEDAGSSWALRSQVTQHEPPSVRMNLAAGINAQGHLVVLCSGWSLDGAGGNPRGVTIPPWVCISQDNGHTWEQVGEIAPAGGEIPVYPEPPVLIPFGDICLNGEELVASCYSSNCSVLLRSADGGRTWGGASVIGAHNYNETDLLIPREGPWLAVVRLAALRTDEPGIGLGANLRLFRSTDEGMTWEAGEYLTLPSQHPGHLLELADGRVLLSYGSRIPRFRGVMGRVSSDGGATWCTPFVIVGGLLEGDLGYPSSVQVEGGEIVTAYYANCAPWHQRYHMGVVRWSLDAVPIE